MPYAVQVILAILAVPGLYFVMISLIGLFFQREKYALAICGDAYSAYDLLTEVRAAQILCEGKPLYRPSPIVFFFSEPSEETANLLTDHGIPFVKLSA